MTSEGSGIFRLPRGTRFNFQASKQQVPESPVYLPGSSSNTKSFEELQS
jgi:hypothetical protein